MFGEITNLLAFFFWSNLGLSKQTLASTNCRVILFLVLLWQQDVQLPYLYCVTVLYQEDIKKTDLFTRYQLRNLNTKVLTSVQFSLPHEEMYSHDRLQMHTWFNEKNELH